MVQFAQIFGVAALLSHSVLAAPAARRSYDSSPQMDSSMPMGDSSMPMADSSMPMADSTMPMADSATQMDSSSMSMDSSSMAMDSSSMSMDNSYMQPQQYGQANQYGNQYTTADATKAMATSQAMYTTSAAYAAQTTADATSVETMSASSPAATYGSGQSSWGQGYNDCVSKCVAQYGSPPMQWQPSESMAPPPDNKGVIHTVMVAPMQGVLRYWPFAVNASVGDTIRYVWTTPANHTATLSSALAICNKSAKADELKWASGVRNASNGTPNIFDVTIQTAETQFFYCSVAQHCNKGMFGMVQPKMGGNNTVSFHMDNWLQSNPDLQAAWSNVHNQTKGTSADTWGNNMSLDGIPESSYMDLAKNIIWNRAMFAANKGSLEANSAQTSDNSPIKVVGDLNTFLASTSQDPPSSVPQGTPTGAVPNPSAAASQLANSTPPAKSGAGLKTSVPVWVAAFVGAVSYMML